MILLEHIEKYDRTESWKQDGVCSMADWLTYRRAMSRRDARELVTVARAVRDLPSIKRAFAASRICWNKLVLLTSFVSRDEDEEWAEEAQKYTFAQLEYMTRWKRRIMRRDAERSIDRRYVRFSHDKSDGALKMNARLPAADGAVVQKAIERIAEQLPPRPDGIYDHQGRGADALVMMASSQLADDADTDRATIVVHVEAAALNHIHGTAELEDGAPIASETARRLACDARVQLLFHGDHGVVGAGRTTRTVPRWLHRQLMKRDRGCRFADCGRTRGLQAHHIVHWAHGGRTDIDNLVMLCQIHHRKVHEEGWRLIFDGRDRVRVVRPDGRPLRTAPAPLRSDLRERLFGPSKVPRKIPALGLACSCGRRGLVRRVGLHRARHRSQARPEAAYAVRVQNMQSR